MSAGQVSFPLRDNDPTVFEGVDWLIEATKAYKRGDRQSAIAAALISLAHTAEEGQ